MPQMGESIAEGTLSKWLKKIGDEIKRDEPIFEISTDKVDAEIPAPVAGVLAEVLVKEGETVAVQTVVARLETEKGATIEASVPAPQPAEAVGAAAASDQPQADAQSGGPPPKKESSAGAAASPHQSTAPSTVSAPGHNGNSFEERIRTKSSPLVRKMAAEHGVDITALQGSGIAGRVTKKDLMGFIREGIPAAARAGSMHAPGGIPGDGGHFPLPEPWPGDTVEPMS